MFDSLAGRWRPRLNGTVVFVLALLALGATGIRYGVAHSGVSTAKMYMPSVTDRSWGGNYPSESLHGLDVSLRDTDFEIESDNDDNRAWVRAYCMADTSMEPELSDWVDNNRVDIETRNGRLIVRNASDKATSELRQAPGVSQMIVLIHLPRSMGINLIGGMTSSDLSMDWNPPKNPTILRRSDTRVEPIERLVGRVASGDFHMRLEKAPRLGVNMRLDQGNFVAKVPTPSDQGNATSETDEHRGLIFQGKNQGRSNAWSAAYGKSGSQVRLQVGKGRLRVFTLRPTDSSLLSL